MEVSRCWFNSKVSGALLPLSHARARGRARGHGARRSPRIPDTLSPGYRPKECETTQSRWYEYPLVRPCRSRSQSGCRLDPAA
eukprot:scaffold49462_cov60-Phaeocystis_antarctica.AAC.1